MCNNIPNTDTEKLHLENGQLRNQQFQITLASITFFGVANGWITNIKDITKDCLITSILLVILGVLFFWSRRLKHLIDVISSYLKIREVSVWEYDYNEYSHKNNIGQTRFLAFVYLVLGISSPLILFFDNKDEFQLFSISCLLPLVFCVVYIILVVYYGYWKHIGNEENIKNKWIDAINKAGKVKAPNA
jgi:hypothetical protein